MATTIDPTRAAGLEVDTMTTVALANRPVSVAECRAFIDATGRAWRALSAGWTDEHPAVYVSWHDANAYCEWRTANGQPCRLPTDAEWTAAAEAGDWRIDASPSSPSVSVWEWASTPWDGELDTPDALRVVRGGSWFSRRFNVRAAYRYRDEPGYRGSNLGFRVVLSAPAGALSSGDAGL